MMRRYVILVLALLLGSAAQAQQPAPGSYWVQLAALPTQAEAAARAQDFAARAADVAGVALGRRWFAVVTGPYPGATEARAALDRLQQSGTAPADAYVTDGARFGDRFWPAPAGAGSPQDETPAGKPVAAGANPPAAQTQAMADEVEMQMVRDYASGIAVQIPTGVVAFRAYQPPFVRFDAGNGSPALVLLISQSGDAARLSDLFATLQSLEVFSPQGPRSRDDDSFEIAATGSGIRSYATARLADGNIKGFALVWPGDDRRGFDRVLAAMQDSFTPLPGVLDPAIAPPDESQAVDLVAGLRIRQPKVSRSGFYIDAAGRVLTDAAAVADCAAVTIDTDHAATVTLRDPDLGIAVLTPVDPLSPSVVPAFQTQVPRLQARVAVAGYPFGGVLDAPTLTNGRLSDIRGLNGESSLRRLTLTARDGDAGGPVLDAGGAVLGLLLPRATTADGQVLPADVAFARSTPAILSALDAAGIAARTTDTLAPVKDDTVAQQAADSTVLVGCW